MYFQYIKSSKLSICLTFKVPVELAFATVIFFEPPYLPKILFELLPKLIYPDITSDFIYLAAIINNFFFN